MSNPTPDPAEGRRLLADDELFNAAGRMLAEEIETDSDTLIAVLDYARSAADCLAAVEAERDRLANLHACDMNNNVLIGLARDDAEAQVKTLTTELATLRERVKALEDEVARLRRELMAALVADQEHGSGMSIILRNWRSRGQPDSDWRALEVAVQFGVDTPEVSVISEYLCEGGVIYHAVHPSGIASARARTLTGGGA